MRNISNNIETDGFSLVPKELYNSDSNSLFSFQASFHSLAKDPSHGGRYRAYSRYEYKEGKLELANSQVYAQSKEYNDEDGGKARNFTPISSEVLNNDLLVSIIKSNIEIVKLTSEVDFSSKVNIGLHQIRYSGTKNSPSYASPLWLHRDDETIVFIHLLNLSANSYGGDNLIAENPKKVNYSTRLIEPLDTLVVSKKHLHAVTPLGSNSNSIACRDILLVTFENEANISVRINKNLEKNNYAY